MERLRKSKTKNTFGNTLKIYGVKENHKYHGERRVWVFVWLPVVRLG